MKKDPTPKAAKSVGGDLRWAAIFGISGVVLLIVGGEVLTHHRVTRPVSRIDFLYKMDYLSVGTKKSRVSGVLYIGNLFSLMRQHRPPARPLCYSILLRHHL